MLLTFPKTLGWYPQEGTQLTPGRPRNHRVEKPAGLADAPVESQGMLRPGGESCSQVWTEQFGFEEPCFSQNLRLRETHWHWVCQHGAVALQLANLWEVLALGIAFPCQ